MNRMRLAFAVLAGLAATGCVHPRAERVTDHRTISAGDVKSAHVQLDMGAGELTVTRGGDYLLDGDFTFSRARTPDVKYDVSAGRGYLTVRQRASRGFGGNEMRWDLKLTDRLPLDLHVNMGAGTARLNLSGMEITRVDVDLGAGEIDLDLTGNWKSDLDGRINGGVGEATVRLPRDVGVRVRASGGIGSINVTGLERDGAYYVNSAYGKSAVSLRLEVHGGIGQINLIG